jgi:hypothetical protein
MTDEEFFTTLTALRDHAKTRRLEAFGTDEEKYGEWSSLYTDLDGVLMRRKMDRTLKSWERGRKRSDDDAPGAKDPA